MSLYRKDIQPECALLAPQQERRARTNPRQCCCALLGGGAQRVGQAWRAAAAGFGISELRRLRIWGGAGATSASPSGVQPQGRASLWRGFCCSSMTSMAGCRWYSSGRAHTCASSASAGSAEIAVYRVKAPVVIREVSTRTPGAQLQHAPLHQMSQLTCGDRCGEGRARCSSARSYRRPTASQLLWTSSTLTSGDSSHALCASSSPPALPGAHSCSAHLLHLNMLPRQTATTTLISYPGSA